jgi:hypothetical protein
MVQSRSGDHHQLFARSSAGRDESRAMRTPDVSWLLAATGASSVAPSALPWWQRALIALRSPVWPAILTSLMVVGLLLAFQQIVANPSSKLSYGARPRHAGQWHLALQALAPCRQSRQLLGSWAPQVFMPLRGPQTLP